MFKIQGRNYEESFKKCCLILRVLEKGFSGDMRNERELYVPWKIWGYSSAGRAPALQAGGQRFDPVYLHQQAEPAEKAKVKAEAD